MMSDVTKIPASILDALYSHYKEELLVISDELINVSLGTASGEEINKLAANGDLLAIRYVEAQNAFLEVAYERSVSLQQRGSTKPVRSKAAEVYSAVQRSPRRKKALPPFPIVQARTCFATSGRSLYTPCHCRGRASV